MIQTLKSKFRDGAVHRWTRRLQDRSVLDQWQKDGRPIPPPPAFKQGLLRETAKHFNTRVLVETGTFWGNTISALLGTFDVIYSIELSDEFYARAVHRFSRQRKVKLRHGDSARELPQILNELQQRALFWLDAHYSGGGTARAAVDSPVIQEMRSVAGHKIQDHVILIDDARFFIGTDGYPTIEDCRTAAAQYWPSHKFDVANDVIAISPSR